MVVVVVVESRTCCVGLLCRCELTQVLCNLRWNPTQESPPKGDSSTNDGLGSRFISSLGTLARGVIVELEYELPRPGRVLEEDAAAIQKLLAISRSLQLPTTQLFSDPGKKGPFLGLDHFSGAATKKKEKGGH